MTDLEPLVVTVDVDAAPDAAFVAFTERFGDWWPVATHTLSRHAATRCRLDALAGGVLEESAPDGARHLWGTVESIDPGRSLRFTWHPGREPESAQWVDVSFAMHGSGTRVTLVHGGWEALGEIAPILHREYAAGWREVLQGAFARYARQPD